MSKNKSAAVTVRFRSPSFIHKGQKYLSKDVEAAAKGGDEAALLIIAELVNKKSGVIMFEEAAAAPAAPKAPKAPKQPKAPKASKAPKGPKVDDGAAGGEGAETKKEAPNA